MTFFLENKYECIDQKLVYAAAKARGRHFVFTHYRCKMTSLPPSRNYDVKIKSLNVFTPDYILI